MFAVVRTGGKQYRVAAGDKIAVEKIPGEAGDSITLGDVLLSGEGGALGAAGGVAVTAEIIAQAKGEKVIVFKKRRRHNYRRKQGHRQQYTILRITAVGDSRAEDRPARATAQPAANDAPAQSATSVPAPNSGETMVAQDAPLKVEGAESALVDAPKKKGKAKSETSESETPAAAEPLKTTGDDGAAKKKSTRKPKSDTGEADAAPAGNGDDA